MTRDELAKQQRALVAALVAGEPRPDGFDPAALQAATEALLNKRASEVAHRAPELKYELGADFASSFRAWARSRPKTTTAADAMAFREHLVRLGIIKAAPPRPNWWQRLRRNS